MTTSCVSPLRLLIIGAPGSGKGTQCERLLRDFPFLQWISTGHLIRTELQREHSTELGTQLKNSVHQGGLIPTHLMVSMLETHSKSVTHPTSSSSSSSSSWILDGFPRSLDQVHHLHHVWGVTLDGVIHLDVSTQVLMDRITQRWIHVSSGRTYHTTYNPPRTLYLDDVTNEKLQQREEDTPAVFQTRLQTYMTQIQPVLEYYQSQHSLVSFQGDTSDAIYPKLVHWVTQLMKKKQN